MTRTLLILAFALILASCMVASDAKKPKTTVSSDDVEVLNFLTDALHRITDKVKGKNKQDYEADVLQIDDLDDDEPNKGSNSNKQSSSKYDDAFSLEDFEEELEESSTLSFDDTEQEDAFSLEDFEEFSGGNSPSGGSKRSVSRKIKNALNLVESMSMEERKAFSTELKNRAEKARLERLNSTEFITERVKHIIQRAKDSGKINKNNFKQFLEKLKNIVKAAQNGDEEAMTLFDRLGSSGSSGSRGRNPGPNSGRNPGPNSGRNPGPNSGPNSGRNSGPNSGPNSGRNPGPNSGRNPGPNSGRNPGPNSGRNSGHGYPSGGSRPH